MRKVIVSMNLTLDGFMSGPNNELNWHFQSWNAEMSESATEQLNKADTILLGGITYRAMAAFWTSDDRTLGIPREDIAFSEMLNSRTKIVFSNALTNPAWNNSKQAKEGIADEIVKLKNQPGKDIIVYGSGEIVNALIHMELVDEFRIWIHPVIIGMGRRLFKDLNKKLPLRLVRSKAFNSGVVLLFYKPIHGK